MRIFTDEKTGGESDEDSGGKGLYADFYKRGGIFHSAGNEIADRFADLLNPATGFSAYAHREESRLFSMRLPETP